MFQLTIDPGKLTLNQLRRIMAQPVQVTFAPHCMHAIEQSVKTVRDVVEQGRAILRREVSFYDQDRYFAPDIKKAAILMESGIFNPLVTQDLLPSFI